MPESILVVGGAGYIGSHMVKLLNESDYEVTVLDNLSTGHRDAIAESQLVVGDLGDEAVLETLFQQRRFDAVMHFAALIQVGESVTEPALYYENNLSKTLTLLRVMLKHGLARFVFSSTAAVYGEPTMADLSENVSRRPINPYGRSKNFVEDILADYDRAYSFRSVCLRYFNAAGSDPAGRLGERHEPETHLIPLVLQAASGRRDKITIFGDSYDTPDGTCIRDFVHVEDLCRAHELALRHLIEGGASERLNLGCASGYSVREVIEVARRVTGRDIPVEVVAPRAGDPARLVADTTRIRSRFCWTPRFGLEDMIRHAWQWECSMSSPTTPSRESGGW